MSILIPGMTLPKDGEMLVLCVGYNGKVLHPIEFATEDFLFAETGKTAIELPPHGRLIDADALRRTMYHEAFETDSPMQKWDSGCWIRYKLFERMEEAAPTIIPADREEDT